MRTGGLVSILRNLLITFLIAVTKHPDKKQLKGEEGLNLPYSARRATVYLAGEVMEVPVTLHYREQRGMGAGISNPHLASFLPQLTLFCFGFAVLENSATSS